jgi:hypothetical protein
MNRPLISKEIGGLVISIVFLLLGFLVVWAMKSMLITAGDAVLISLFLVPILVYVIFTGRLSELKGPGGLELKLQTMASQPADELASQRVEFVEEDMVPVSKGSIQELDRLERLLDPTKRIVLKLVLGEMQYNRGDAIEYLERFLRYPNFKHVAFLDKKHRFVAFVPPWAMLRILTGEEGERFVQIINGGNLLELLDFPGVLTLSINSRATYMDALKSMSDHNLETILVTGQDGKVIGVVDREQVLSKLLLAMAK